MIIPQRRAAASAGLPVKLCWMSLVAAGLVTCAQPTGSRQQADRIHQPLEDGQVFTLRDGVNPLVARSTDLGQVSPDFALPAISVKFSLTSAQQQDLDALLAAQQDPASPLFHRWLTPEEFGERFGLSDRDLAQVQSWLANQGFTVTRVTRARLQIFFAGTADAVARSFRTEVHRLTLEGESHFALVKPATLPAALKGVALGLGGLDDFAPKPGGRTHRVPAPRYTNGTTHTLAPQDFATIYDVQPLYNASIDGSGVTIGVIGQTFYYPNDVTTFRSLSGLPASTVNNLLVPNSGGASTIVSADLDEAEGDIEWSGAVAPGAKQVFVYTGGTSNGLNVYDALDYAIDNKVATILTISYNSCESYFSSTDFASQRQTAQQANAEGMTIVNCSGDSGAAGAYGCDYHATVASYGPEVNFPTNMPEVTGVGGTEFVDSSGSYWTSTNTSIYGSARSYIPETGWNDTKAELAMSGGTLAASNGGVSKLIAKPSWQTGTGVPNDGYRDVPDVSFNSSYYHVGYLICQDQACVNGWEDSTGIYTWFGGTSVAAPSFAGVLALVEQASGQSAGLGNVNSKLYQLAASNPGVFHDITSGNNVVPCTPGSLGCPSAAPYQFGYDAKAGYDQVTGLGSLDVAKFVDAWAGISTTTSTSGSTNGTTAARSTATGRSTGTSAGPTTSTSGGTGSCGAQNFTTQCPNNVTCPADSTCAGSDCVCDRGYIDVDCSGNPCLSGCSYPNWWCIPRTPGACGAVNFTLQCSYADGGVFYCPTNGVCQSNGNCGCQTGTQAVDCSGNACTGGCTYPTWWCEAPSGVTSAATGTVSGAATGAVSGATNTVGGNSAAIGGNSAAVGGSSGGAALNTGINGGSSGGTPGARSSNTGTAGGTSASAGATTSGSTFFTTAVSSSSSGGTTGGGSGCGCSAQGGGADSVWLALAMLGAALGWGPWGRRRSSARR